MKCAASRGGTLGIVLRHKSLSTTVKQRFLTLSVSHAEHTTLRKVWMHAALQTLHVEHAGLTLAPDSRHIVAF
jgi:hypothetical protein